MDEILPSSTSIAKSYLSIISLLKSDINFPNKWSLDRRRILHPAQNQNMTELYKVPYDQFQRNLKTNNKGSYEITLS